MTMATTIKGEGRMQCGGRVPMNNNGYGCGDEQAKVAHTSAATLRILLLRLERSLGREITQSSIAPHLERGRQNLIELVARGCL